MFGFVKMTSVGNCLERKVDLKLWRVARRSGQQCTWEGRSAAERWSSDARALVWMGVGTEE
jgi:hypothetical protein